MRRMIFIDFAQQSSSHLFILLQNRNTTFVRLDCNKFELKLELYLIIPAACVEMILVITDFKHDVSPGLHCGNDAAKRKIIINTHNFNTIKDIESFRQ